MYQPDPKTLPILGGIAALLATATAIDQEFARQPKFLATLPGGQLYFDSALELDTDGWPNGNILGDPDWQADTSLRYAGGHSLDANRVPYIVLPLPAHWPAQFGIHLGDHAAVIYRNRLAFAVFGDQGNANKIGEGSIALLRRLGEERIKANGHVLNAGTGAGVITIVFPGSGNAVKPPDEQTLLASLATVGPPLFTALGGKIPAPATT